MALNIRALAVAGAVLWGGTFGLLALANLLWPPYGDAVLALGASIYPGYHGHAGIGGVVVVTVYGLLDGAIGGAVLAWAYNRVAGARHAA